MRKLPLIVALVSISLVGAYALVVNLLPNTTEFPRIPTGPGTIGGTITQILGISDLENYTGDGTVPNTMMLSGTTATGYLRGLNCGAGQVWKTLGGGMPTCANKDATLALLGTTSSISGTVTVYHADGIFEVISSATGILEGDIIRTNPGSAVTIVFSDLSLLRIDEDSTVSLDTGTLPDGTNIAYAILENGGLWGRVLTETGGYYIGRDDLIVGVRGTSVYFTQHNPTVSILEIPQGWSILKTQSGGIGTLSVIDSSTIGTVATLDCIDSTGMSHHTVIATGMTVPFGASNLLCPDIANVPRLARDRVFARADIMTKVTENTVKDLQYLSQYVFSGANTLTPGKKARILSEYNATFPRSAADLDAICPDSAQGPIKTFWPTLIGTGIEMDPCQDQRVLAVADFRRIDLHQERSKLFLRTGSPVSPLLGAGEIVTYESTAFGARINAVGNYLGFDTSTLDLRGKTVTIKFQDVLDLAGEAPVKRYILIGGPVKYYATNRKCDSLSQVEVNEKKICQFDGVSTVVFPPLNAGWDIGTSKEISLPIPLNLVSSPDRLIFGSNFDNFNYANPLKNKIQGIRIE